MPSELTPEDFAGDAEAARWNYRPPHPVQTNPLFAWPPRPMAILRWYQAYWLVLSSTTVALVFSTIIYLTLLPALEDMQSFAPGWVIRVWLGNLIPHCLLAGGLHIWLYRVKGQGDRFKFDSRDPAINNGIFTFNNQIHDNMFWTIVSGITLWSAMQVLIYWAMANGYAPRLFFPSNPLWFIVMFPLVIIWSSLHFYWVHRLLHWPPLYRWAHALHHRNINVGPWSGISMHPIEHLLFFTNFLIHFILPSHPIHVVFHGYMQSVHPIFSHSGFEQLSVKDRERAQMGDFFHQLHHRYFECNYGSVEMPWDRWFGSFHDGSHGDTLKTRARKKQMYME